MVVPVDLPSVKPRSQCFVRRVNSSLKLWHRKQLHFPALASLTYTECTAHTPTAGSHILQPTDIPQHLCPEGAKNIMQMRQIIRWTASFAPPYNIQIHKTGASMEWWHALVQLSRKQSIPGGNTTVLLASRAGALPPTRMPTAWCHSSAATNNEDHAVKSGSLRHASTSLGMKTHQVITVTNKLHSYCFNQRFAQRVFYLLLMGFSSFS